MSLTTEDLYKRVAEIILALPVGAGESEFKWSPIVFDEQRNPRQNRDRAFHLRPSFPAISLSAVDIKMPLAMEIGVLYMVSGGQQNQHEVLASRLNDVSKIVSALLSDSALNADGTADAEVLDSPDPQFLILIINMQFDHCVSVQS